MRKSTAQRVETLRSLVVAPLPWQAIVLSLVASILVLLLATQNPFPGVPAPPHAGLVLASITLATAFLVRWLRERSGLDARAALALPDPLFTLYLAVLILAGLPTALVLAVATPLVSSIPDLLHAPARAGAELRRAAVAGLTTLVAGLLYPVVAHTLSTKAFSLRASVAAALLASLVMLAGTVCLRVLEQWPTYGTARAAWVGYLASRVLRFQVLLLAIGPLLPLAQRLDDVEAELAWTLFLIPLFAMYYLAVVSVRLEQRTSELQHTIEALGLARKREAELTNYAALVTRAQEEERRRLARELHDDTAQAMVALSRGLDALSASRGGALASEREARFLEELGELANRSLESIRRACQDLRPSVLDDLGLPAALESLAQSQTKRGLACEFELEGQSEPCAPEVEVTVYRIAQEALSNALRHARATASSLRVAYSADALHLTVRDDGRGFADASRRDAAQAAANGTDGEVHSGLGLMGMRERAALIGARLEILSAPGAGTRIELHVPLHQREVLSHELAWPPRASSAL